MSAVPSNGAARPPAQQQALNEYVYTILSRLRYLQTWLEDPDHALELDPQFYEKVSREITIEAARIYRRQRVAGTSATVHLEAGDPDSKALVPIFEKLLSYLQRYDTARFNLADAFFQGWTVAKIEGEFANLIVPGDMVERRWWVPTQLRDIGKGSVRREFVYEPDLQERWTIFDFYTHRWVVLGPEDVYRYIVHQYDTQHRHVSYAGGLAARLVYYWTVKTIAFETWVRGADRWGFGWVVAKISNLLGGSTTDNLETYRKKVDVVIESLEKQRERHIYVHDKDRLELEVVHPPEHAGKTLLAMIEYCDRQTTILQLGSYLPTGQGSTEHSSGGSLARSKTEQESREALFTYDRSALAETLSQGLHGSIWYYNYANFVDLGLDTLRYPRAVLKDEEKPDTQDSVMSAQAILGYGLPLKKSEVYRRLGGWTPPDADDDMLAPPMQAQGAQDLPGAAAPGMGGGQAPGAEGAGASPTKCWMECRKSPGIAEAPGGFDPAATAISGAPQPGAGFSAQRFAFNPSQARGPDGRWVAGQAQGASGGPQAQGVAGLSGGSYQPEAPHWSRNLPHAKIAAEHAQKSWNQLDPEVRSYLEKVGLDENRWFTFPNSRERWLEPYAKAKVAEQGQPQAPAQQPQAPTQGPAPAAGSQPRAPAQQKLSKETRDQERQAKREARDQERQAKREARDQERQQKNQDREAAKLAKERERIVREREKELKRTEAEERARVRQGEELKTLAVAGPILQGSDILVGGADKAQLPFKYQVGQLTLHSHQELSDRQAHAYASQHPSWSQQDTIRRIREASRTPL